MGDEDMTAVDALKAARSANVHIGLEGEDLVLRAPAPPPAAVLDALKRHKPGIVALLRRARSNWTAADWEAFFHERAGIAEHDGGLAAPASRRTRLRALCRGMAHAPLSAIQSRHLPQLRAC